MNNIIRPAEEIRLMPLSLEKQTVATLRNTTAIAERDELLMRSHNIERVIGDSSQAQALEMLGAINAAIKTAEASKKEVKEPFNAICKTIEELLRDHSTPLAAEKERLKRLLANYQLEVELKSKDDSRKLEVERQRIQAEQDAVTAAEANRQKDLYSQAQAAKSEDDRKRIAEEQRKSAADTAMKQTELEIAKASTLQVEAPKLAGMSVRKPWRVEVVDVVALYKARPDMVTLTPRQAELNKLVAGAAGIREIAGCRVFEDMDVTTR